MATEQVNILLEAQDNASKPLKNLRGEIDKVGSSAKKTARLPKVISGSLGDAGRSAGQAGIQFQQFVGQYKVVLIL